MQSQYTSLLAAAEQLRREGIAAANMSRANHVALAYQTWTSDIGTTRVTFASQAAGEVNRLAGQLRTYGNQFALADAAAIQARIGSVAGAVSTYYVTDVGLQATLDNALAAEDRDLGIDVAQLQGDKSQDEVAARGVYETTLYTHHATARAAAALSSPTLLDSYQAAYAAADQLWSIQQRDALNAFEEELTGHKVSAATRLAEAGYTETTALSTVATTIAPSQASAEESRTLAGADAQTGLSVDLHRAYSKAMVGGIGADVGFGISFAENEQTYNDQLSTAYVTWVAAVAAAESVYFLSPQTQVDADAKAAAIQLATDQRTLAEQAARLQNIQDVGDAHIQRVTSWGAAGITLATEQGDAEVGFTNQENVAETDHAAAVKIVATELADLVSQANAVYVVVIAEAAVELTSDTGLATTGLQTEFNSHVVVRAQSRADAAADFQIPLAAEQASAHLAFASSVGTAESLFQAARAAAFADWICAVAEDYQTYVSDFTQTQMDSLLEKTLAESSLSNALAVSNIDLITDLGDQQHQLTVDDVTALQSDKTATVGHTNALLLEIALAEQQLRVDQAMADSQFLVDLLIAQRQYQADLTVELPDADTHRIAAAAQAEYGLKQRYADAHLAWKQNVAPAVATMVHNDAVSTVGLATTWSANGAVYDSAVTAAETEHLSDRDTIQSDYAGALAQADWQQTVAAATIRSTYWKAENEYRVIALTDFAAALGTPWAQFVADAAQANRDWWSDQEPAYLAWQASLVMDASSYQAAAAVASQARSASYAATDISYVNTLTGVQQAWAVERVEAERQHAQALAAAYEDYQQDVALAERDFQVTLAAARRDFEISGSQEDYDSTVGLANVDKAIALKVAADAYASAAVIAEAMRTVAQAQAELTYVQAAGPQEVQLVDAYFSAELDYATTETADYVDSTTQVANGSAAYFTQESGSFSTAIATWANGHPSPWATFRKDKVAAKHQATTVTAGATAAREIALAQAVAVREVDQATARHTYAVAMAQIQSEQRIARAEAALRQALDKQDALTAVAATAGALGVLAVLDEVDQSLAGLPALEPLRREPDMDDVDTAVGSFATATQFTPIPAGSLVFTVTSETPVAHREPLDTITGGGLPEEEELRVIVVNPHLIELWGILKENGVEWPVASRLIPSNGDQGTPPTLILTLTIPEAYLEESTAQAEPTVPAGQRTADEFTIVGATLHAATCHLLEAGRKLSNATIGHVFDLSYQNRWLDQQWDRSNLDDTTIAVSKGAAGVGAHALLLAVPAKGIELASKTNVAKAIVQSSPLVRNSLTVAGLAGSGGSGYAAYQSGHAAYDSLQAGDLEGAIEYTGKATIDAIFAAQILQALKTLRAPKEAALETPTGGAPNSAVTRTNAQLVDEIGTRSRAWAQRKQLTGSARELGTRQHKHARDVLDRYQQMFGDRGLVTERSFINGLEVPYGSKGSTRLDVLDTITGDVWDYKFGVTPMSQGQINRIFQHGPGINLVTPLYK